MQHYWAAAGATKTFYCPFDLDLFKIHVSANAPILDYGCGYGRLLKVLAEAGYTNLTGVDASPVMVERAREAVPQTDIRRVEPSEVPFAPESFDAVILYSVLSSVLEPEGQPQLINDLQRALRAGGILYFHDFIVQTRNVERNRERYALGAQHYAPNVFVDPTDKAAFQHFTEARLTELFGSFSCVTSRHVPTRSMNGSFHDAFQLFLRKDDT